MSDTESQKSTEWKWEHEWYIYSSIAITGAIMFIVISISNGTPQIIGASMSPVVGGLFALNKSWQNAPIEHHKSAILVSVTAVLLFSLFVKIFGSKNNE